MAQMKNSQVHATSIAYLPRGSSSLQGSDAKLRAGTPDESIRLANNILKLKTQYDNFKLYENLLLVQSNNLNQSYRLSA